MSEIKIPVEERVRRWIWPCWLFLKKHKWALEQVCSWAGHGVGCPESIVVCANCGLSTGRGGGYDDISYNVNFIASNPLRAPSRAPFVAIGGSGLDEDELSETVKALDAVHGIDLGRFFREVRGAWSEEHHKKVAKEESERFQAKVRENIEKARRLLEGQ